MLESADLRKGLKIEIDGAPYILTQFEFVKPGKGQALYKCRLKNMLTGAQFDRTYRSGEKFNDKEAALRLSQRAGKILVKSSYGMIERQFEMNPSLPPGQIFIPMAVNGNDAMNLVNLTQPGQPGTYGWTVCKVSIDKI